MTIAAVTLSACGGADDNAPLRVSAAASLKAAFTDLGRAPGAGRASFSFAGSDLLAGQIRGGARPDVFAAANATLPAQLFREGLVERPVPFARNRLVIAVAPDARSVRSVRDLGRPGVRLAIGAAGVPVGAYTRTVLGRLPQATRRAILANVRSEEPDVSGIVGKVAQGAVTAGVVYASDVTAARGRLTAVPLPPALQPEVTYAAAVVRGAPAVEQARRFVATLTAPAGQAALHRAGLLAPAR
jgi:molybdate transport system substrate-binding protein